MLRVMLLHFSSQHVVSQSCTDAGEVNRSARFIQPSCGVPWTLNKSSFLVQAAAAMYFAGRADTFEDELPMRRRGDRGALNHRLGYTC